MIEKFGKEKIEEMKNDKTPYELKTREIEDKIKHYKEVNEKMMKRKHLY